ncbi:hypothetical protein WN944_024832 [Citrus x changshan-huyou]|uniref:Uncharacterized protein n=1 Tax=Citrus x changshan-huyou TaxID=2935761 RepID=A0AAP0LRB7_9ROSI
MNAVLGLLKALEVNQMAATVKGRLLVLVLGLQAIKSNVMEKSIADFFEELIVEDSIAKSHLLLQFLRFIDVGQYLH